MAVNKAKELDGAIRDVAKSFKDCLRITINPIPGRVGVLVEMSYLSQNRKVIIHVGTQTTAEWHTEELYRSRIYKQLAAALMKQIDSALQTVYEKK